MDSNYPMALAEGTILNGAYIIKKVLGQGGFGITYEAAVHKSNELVAIKEYFPDTMASRTSQTEVTPYTGERGTNFTYGKQCFLEEAKTLANFNGNPAIVDVKKYFEENGTAYFVMDYITGKSFKAYLEEKGGKIPFNEAMEIITPVMDALSAVHAKGIIHRDVTPDNIYITDSGQVKLLDFGAARYSLGDKSRSLDVVLKHGYAPKEQYTRHGRQGPYTDVYALAVTIYRAVTGRLIPDSIDRLEEDEIVLPAAFGVNMTDAQEAALFKALAVDYKERYHSMAEFKAALLGGQSSSSGESGGGGREIVFDTPDQGKTVLPSQNAASGATAQQPNTVVQPQATGQTSVATGAGSGMTAGTGTSVASLQPAVAKPSPGAKGMSQTNKIILIVTAAAIAIIAFIVVTVIMVNKNSGNNAVSGTESIPDAPSVSGDETPDGTPETPGDVELVTEGGSGTATTEDPPSLGKIDTSKLTTAAGYEFTDRGILFDSSASLSLDIDEDVMEISYDPTDGSTGKVYMVDFGQCGEVDTYLQTLEDIAVWQDIEYTTDLTPLTVGKYPGWLAGFTGLGNSLYKNGYVLLITPYVGVSRRMVGLVGEDTKVFNEIINTLNIDGAHTEDLSGVDTTNTYKIPRNSDTGSSGDGYLFSDSSERLLTQADIDDLYRRVENAYAQENSGNDVNYYMAMVLCYARNEIFARNGRKFSSSELQEYFNGMEWYEPRYDAKEFDYVNLTEIEKKNVDFIKEQEKTYGNYTPKK
ncbi:MAG: protein kinase [Lachnospiraceae bacterium]|nr:protein kinase [Lachnospiraceae bacterium]